LRAFAACKACDASITFSAAVPDSHELFMTAFCIVLTRKILK
jgi:hypothetical protein